MPDDSIDFDEIERYSKWKDLQTDTPGMQLDFDWVFMYLPGAGPGPDWFDYDKGNRLTPYDRKITRQLNTIGRIGFFDR